MDSSYPVPVPGSKARRDSLLKCQAGILVTEDLAQAVKHCRDKVLRLARECREGNRKYRDLEFDLLEDKERCLHRLGYNREDPRYKPDDVRRITEMVKDPKFLVDDATASDICQGNIGDCWFLSALAVVATTTRVLDKICVEKDEKIGIYGFIFWRDSGWAEVIIDDLLFTKIPPWNRLQLTDRAMFRNDKRTYNTRARQGLFENLYFAKSKTDNETWVPLIEKAYAKLHGDYQSLESGFTSEGVEDLTGGVSTIIYTRDILDTDKFWEDELLNVGQDRLFACFTPGTTPGASEDYLTALDGEENEGLISGHAYSIIKAIDFVSEDKEHKGKFLRIRNPWGRKEWSGRWSDGSEQWNEPWTDQLRKALGDDKGRPYKFGDDGEFVQEYTDFLDCWEIIERSRLFDEGWKMSSQWLAMPSDAHLTPWSLGDLSFTVDIAAEKIGDVEPQEKAGDLEPQETVIVLAQRDKRYFRELSGPYLWSMDFVLYRRGEKLPMTRSVHSTLWDRSVKLEVKLAPGRYIIHARLDCKLKDPPADMPDWRKGNRKQMALAASAIIATNCHDHSLLSQHLTLPPSELAGSDLGEIEIRAHAEAIRSRKATEKLLARKDITVDTTNTQQGPSSHPTDLLTPATNLGSSFAHHPFHPPPIANADSDTQEIEVTYHEEPEEYHSESPTSSVREHRSIDVSTPCPKKESHSSTRYYTPSTTFSSRGDSLGEGLSRGSPPLSRKGASTPKPVRGVSNSQPLDPLEKAEPLAQGSQVAQASSDSLMSSRPKSSDPAHSSHTMDLLTGQLESLPHECHSYRHEKFICRGCEQIIKGPMIHCIDIACHNLNLCMHCKDIPIHPADHHLIISVCAEDDRAIHHTFTSPSISDTTSTTNSTTANDSLPPSDLLLGLRVYTRTPFKAKVKGQLRTGSILRNHYFTPKPPGIPDGHHRNESEINSTENQSTN